MSYSTDSRPTSAAGYYAGSNGELHHVPSRTLLGAKRKAARAGWQWNQVWHFDEQGHRSLVSERYESGWSDTDEIDLQRLARTHISAVCAGSQS